MGNIKFNNSGGGGSMKFTGTGPGMRIPSAGASGALPGIFELQTEVGKNGDTYGPVFYNVDIEVYVCNFHISYSGAPQVVQVKKASTGTVVWDYEFYFVESPAVMPDQDFTVVVGPDYGGVELGESYVLVVDGTSSAPVTIPNPTPAITAFEVTRDDATISTVFSLGWTGNHGASVVLKNMVTEEANGFPFSHLMTANVPVWELGDIPVGDYKLIINYDQADEVQSVTKTVPPFNSGSVGIAYFNPIGFEYGEEADFGFGPDVNRVFLAAGYWNATTAKFTAAGADDAILGAGSKKTYDYGFLFPNTATTVTLVIDEGLATEVTATISVV